MQACDKMATRRGFLASLAALAAAGRTPPARANGWPQHPVKIIMPFAPGGNNDGMGRLIAQRLSERLGSQFIVENRPVGMGTVAAEAAAHATADGYTLFWAALPHIAIFPAMTKLNYDPVKDFAPVSNIGSTPFILVVHPSVPATTLHEFVEYVRWQPGKIAYGSGGTGTLTHLSMVLLAQRAGLDLIHVPYAGGALAMADLIAGQTKAYFATLSEAIPQARAGTIRAIAISSPTRSAQLPDVPTVSESGYPGFRMATWNGILAPAGTPQDIIDRLAGEIALAVQQPDIVARLASYGVEPIGGTPQQFAATIAEDIPLWTQAVKMAGLAPQQ
jgi:tripartite-type tricarboxylate transporter receptor subunit TctC